MRTKIPVIMGHVTSAEYFATRCSRIREMVITLPLRTVRINASTSRGLGINVDPAPKRGRMRGGIATTFGRSGFSIFSRQLFLVFIRT